MQGFRLTSLSGALTIAILTLAGSAAFAQDEPEDEPPARADGQAVDEEEAEFRRRMELGEAEGEDRGAPSRPPDIVDVDPRQAPESRLPPSSQDHLEEQLTELIIENGRWEPSDAERPADFEPSEAAQSDPELAAEEAEAWEAMVAAYHERERAAWSGEAGSTGSPGDAGNGGDGQGSGAGTGSGNGQGGGAGAGQGSGAGNTEPTGGSAGTSSPRDPTGDPFSALEFLGGDAENEAPESTEAPQEPQEPQEARSDGTPTESAVETSTEARVEPPQDVDADAGADADADAEAGEEEQQPTADLSSPKPEAPSPTPDSPAVTDPAPGAVDPEALEALFDSAPREAAPSPGSEPPDSRPPTEEPPNGDAEPSDDPPASGPPPQPSIWDWFFDLFSKDEEPEPGSAP